MKRRGCAKGAANAAFGPAARAFGCSLITVSPPAAMKTRIALNAVPALRSALKMRSRHVSLVSEAMRCRELRAAAVSGEEETRAEG